ncbi:MAG: glycosyltransferase family 4 protein [Chloroflexi bacterium]|nr:glycosyltransferase family 4 protein [Chloroflexota bacterium]
MLRIGIFTNSYHPAIHGVVRSVDIFRRELVRLGHDVFVFCPADETYIDNDPQVYRYPSLANYRAMDCRISVPHSFKMDRVIKGLDLDIIHTQHPIFIGYEASRQARRCGIPLVLTYHSQYENVLRTYFDWSEGFFRAIFRILYQRYFGRTDCVITPTESIRRMELARSPDNEGHFVVLPTPLDGDMLLDPHPEPVIERYGLAGHFTFVSTNRLGPEKNLYTMIDAFGLIAERDPSTRLLLVGDGPIRQDLERYIGARKLSHQVVMTGMVPMRDIRNYLAAGDAYVCASLTETQGLALLEAMAMGLPVVATQAPGNSDSVTHEVDGLLTEPNTDSLASGMLTLLQDADLRIRLGQAAREVLVRYDPATLAKRLLAIYQAVIAGKPYPPDLSFNPSARAG